ncbi:AI-2E family transporter [Natranaerobius trueperi]|uniref:AI-2E family transporter n=1 Tax=Natranaerobius trueperi TaxID=759412 RepID=A0A226C0Y9_9FIRM|nr:AI-2E family transporter [Natranaerobius trueperi]OWZ84702.1 hypothetical protein CDO51_01360 [Natranaerobius trueperi]
MDEQTYKSYWHLAIKIIVLIVSIIGFLWFVKEISWVISLLLVSILIVYAISPLTDLLEKQKLSRTSAAAITFLIFILMIIGFLFLTIPRMYSEIKELANHAPVLYQTLNLETYLNQLNKVIEGPEFTEYLSGAFDSLPRALDGIQDLFQHFTQFSIGLISGFFEFLIIMFLVFYLLRDIKDIKNNVISFFPKKYQNEANQVIDVIDLKVGQYLRGNLSRCLLVGIFTSFGLFVLEIRFFFLLGLLAALLNIIVYIGPYIAAFPAILVALSYSFETAIIVSIMYILIQSIDAFILTPILLGKAVDLSPFSTILAITIGGALYGIIGVLISIPLAAVLKVLLNYYYLDRVNKDKKSLVD